MHNNNKQEKMNIKVHLTCASRLTICSEAGRFHGLRAKHAKCKNTCNRVFKTVGAQVHVFEALWTLEARLACPMRTRVSENHNTSFLLTNDLSVNRI